MYDAAKDKEFMKKVEKVMQLIRAGEEDKKYILHLIKQGNSSYIDINPEYYHIVAGLYSQDVVAIIQYLMQNGDVIYSHRDGLYHIVADFEDTNEE